MCTTMIFKDSFMHCYEAKEPHQHGSISEKEHSNSFFDRQCLIAVKNSRVPKSYLSPSSPKYQCQVMRRLDDLCRRKSTIAWFVESSHYNFLNFFVIADNLKTKFVAGGMGENVFACPCVTVNRTIRTVSELLAVSPSLLVVAYRS